MQTATLVLAIACLIVSIIIIIVLRQIIIDINKASNKINDKLEVMNTKMIDLFIETKRDMRIESQTIQVLMETHFLALNGDEYEYYEPNEETKDN